MNSAHQEISVLKEAIIQTLRYFALFKYPLAAEEIHRYCLVKSTSSMIKTTLEVMLKDGDLQISEQKYFSLETNQAWSDERVLGNQRAEELLTRVYRYVRVIKQFPFVDGIAISGSLSKYYAEENADVDYFIITKKNRLWIARTLLHFYKKLTFLRSHQDYYCMNYFVDETALEIQHKNIYTAIELATLIPVYNEEIILELKEKNDWIVKFLPNVSLIQDERFVLPKRKSWLRLASEFLFNILFPTSLNRILMKITDKKWRSKWQRASYPMENYDHAFLTNLHVSKNHPANYQKQVLTSLKSKESHIKPVTCEI